MALSTLSEIHSVLLRHYRTSLTFAYPELFTTNYQFAFSPADDEMSDFRRLEEVRKELKGADNQVVLPSVVLSLSGIAELWRGNSARERWGVGATGSLVSGSRGAPIDLNYRIKLYCKTFDECTTMMEIFMLYIGDVRSIQYTSQKLPGQQFPIQLTYLPPQPARLCDVGDRWGGRGHIYVLHYEVSVHAIIMLTALQLYRRIIKTSQTPFRIGIDGNVGIETVPPDFHDRFEDSITLTDTIVEP